MDAVFLTLYGQILIIERTTDTLKFEIVPLCVKDKWCYHDILGLVNPLGQVNDLILVQVIPAEDGD